MDATAAGARFISLEGPDGAGKSLQAAGLAESLRDAGHRVTLTREPGGTGLGERIRQLLLDSTQTDRSPEGDALLFNAARAQSVNEVIRPALERGEVVVCDRYADSTLAYQGYGSGLSLERLRELERFATRGLRPSLTVLLDLPVDEGLARRGRGAPAELTRFERSSAHDLEFHQRVRRGYLELAALEPARWRVVDASGDAADVAAEIVRVVNEGSPRSEPRGQLLRMHR